MTSRPGKNSQRLFSVDLITTEAMVAELPKKQSAASPMPGGGMDF